MYEFFIFNHNSFIWDNFIKAVEAENPNGKVAFIDKVNEALIPHNGVVRNHYVEFLTEADFIIFRLRFG